MGSYTYKNLTEVRFLKGRLTQQEVADKLGITLTSYALIEKGHRHGSFKTWLKIQKLFNLTDAECWVIQKGTHKQDKE